MPLKQWILPRGFKYIITKVPEYHTATYSAPAYNTEFLSTTALRHGNTTQLLMLLLPTTPKHHFGIMGKYSFFTCIWVNSPFFNLIMCHNCKLLLKLFFFSSTISSCCCWLLIAFIVKGCVDYRMADTKPQHRRISLLHNKLRCSSLLHRGPSKPTTPRHRRTTQLCMQPQFENLNITLLQAATKQTPVYYTKSS